MRELRGIIAILEPPIVFLVYISTLAGLTISYIVGRVIPLRMLIRGLELIRFQRASRLVKTIEPMTNNDRLAFLVFNSPNRFVPFLIRNRYLALILAIILPGNIIIGGGVGLSMMAGISRLFSALGFFVAIAIAAAPIPLAALLFGRAILAN